jgi:Fe-S-cluster-containing dehydrogenase component
MKEHITRRSSLSKIGLTLAGLAALPVAKAAKAAVQNGLASPSAPKAYDPTKHKWVMAIDANRCIGCGLCAEACKKENSVPEGHYFRTWIERYTILKPKPDSAEARGETIVDSPNGGLKGFREPPLKPDNQPVEKAEILHAFFVPKLCNLCLHSPCAQVCPVGATFDAPDGAVLVDPTYCIGCGFCIQACPYGCRFLTPETPETKARGTAGTAQKCTLCYHRITRGLKPACVEVCPTQTRIFGDLMNPVPNDPIQQFYKDNRVQTLKPHLGTEPRVLYAGLDKEVR